MFKVILAAVDTSPRAEGVVRAAVEIAEKFDAGIHLFRAVSIPPEFPAAANNGPDEFIGVLTKQTLDDLHRLAGKSPRIVVDSPRIERREPWRAVLDEAARIGADLIVIGSHGYGGWDVVLGTTAGKVVNRADCSVLVVHDKRPAGKK